MDNHGEPSRFVQIVLIFLPLGMLLAGLWMTVLYADLTTNRGLFSVRFFVHGLIILSTCSCVIAGIMCIIPSSRIMGMRLFLTSCILIGFLTSESYLADRRWETWTQATLSEGDRLIDALHSYYAERGHYPDELLRLVPDYINRIPELQFKYRILGFDYSGGRDTFILSFSVGNAVNCSYRQTTGDDVWECTPVCRVRKENCRFH